MVQKITLFEPHFDGAQFGPTIGGDDAEQPDEHGPTLAASDLPDDETDADTGSITRRLLFLVGAITVLSVAGRLAYGRLNGRDDFDEDVAFETDDPEAEPAVQ